MYDLMQSSIGLVTKPASIKLVAYSNWRWLIFEGNLSQRLRTGGKWRQLNWMMAYLRLMFLVRHYLNWVRHSKWNWLWRLTFQHINELILQESCRGAVHNVGVLVCNLHEQCTHESFYKSEIPNVQRDAQPQYEI